MNQYFERKVKKCTGFEPFHGATQNMSVHMSNQLMQDGVFARNIKKPVLKLDKISTVSRPTDNQSMVHEPEYFQDENKIADPMPRKASVIETGSSPSRQGQHLRAVDQIQRNKTINVFANNEQKSLNQRIRDLNLLHHDISPTNMVAFAQLPMNRLGERDDEY